MINKLLFFLLGPLTNPLLDKVKGFAISGTVGFLAALESTKLASVVGFDVDEKTIGISVGVAVTAFVGECMKAFRSGGTAALQKLLVEKYGLPLKVDDWFGPKTETAVKAVLNNPRA